jgi:hypothetical protein
MRGGTITMTILSKFIASDMNWLGRLEFSANGRSESLSSDMQQIALITLKECHGRNELVVRQYHDQVSSQTALG